jgi:hypothetical protein
MFSEAMSAYLGWITQAGVTLNLHKIFESYRSARMFIEFAANAGGFS